MRPMSRTVRAILANATAWTHWNSEIEQARRAYLGEMAIPDEYARRIAASKKAQRYRARKKEQSR